MKQFEVKQVIKEKDGYSFMVLEEMFWIEVLTVALDLFGGNVDLSSRKLGISRTTFLGRCRKHGIKPKEFKKCKSRIKEEVRQEWKAKLVAVLSKETNFSEAARLLGWNRTTMKSRMKLVGL